MAFETDESVLNSEGCPHSRSCKYTNVTFETDESILFKLTLHMTHGDIEYNLHGPVSL